MIEKHKFAKKQRTYFQTNFSNLEQPNYSEFMKTENPLTDNLVSYKVSYQMNYRGESDSMIIQPKTFYVVGIRGKDSDIYNNVVNMFKDSKGSSSGSGFSSGTLDMIDREFKPSIEPRGLEQSNKKLTKEEIERVISNGYLIDEIDKGVEFTNKKGRTGKMDLNLRHF